MTQTGDVAVRVRDLRKAFGTQEVLHGVDLDVGAGEVMCVIGPSGSGKSTLLRCLNALETPDSGEIRVLGRHVGYTLREGRMHRWRPKEFAAFRAGIGMVFQRFHLFSHMTALENVRCAPVQVRGMDRAAAAKLASDLLDQVGLGEHAGKYPRQLSGGQQQRVAIARALAMDPALLLFDEPTSALDPELVDEVLEVMRTLARSGITMIVVTHEIGFAAQAADNIVFIDEGVVVERGAPAEILDDPQHPRTKAFLSKVL